MSLKRIASFSLHHSKTPIFSNNSLSFFTSMSSVIKYLHRTEKIKCVKYLIHLTLPLSFKPVGNISDFRELLGTR